MMKFDDVMSELKSYGTEQNIKVYKKHGAGDNLYGVSFANLNKLKKKIKKNQNLALKLWDTGNTDAMTLATMIADPSEFTQELSDCWMDDLSYYMLIDLFARDIVAKTPFAKEKMKIWIDSDEEWKGRAGWQLLAWFAMKDDEAQDEIFVSHLRTIETKIHSAKNRVRDAMNNALIAVGMRNDNLEKLAVEAAGRIGKVIVDHGDTSCKTPDAIEYIKKARAREKKN